MDTVPMIEKLKNYGIFSEKEYYDQAFSRNIGLFTKDEQVKLAHAAVGIPGMGGVGGIHFMTMVRTGVGRFHISDFDVYEPANINRQFGARVPEFGRQKMEVMKEQAISVNPFIKIKEFPEGITSGSIDEFLDGLDVVLDSLDFFAFDARRLLFKRAREKGVHVITAGPLGFSSAMLVFAPDKGMGFDEYFDIVKGMKLEDKYIAFALGLAPKATQFKYMDTGKLSFKDGKGPSLNIACQLCSAVAGTEAVKIILKRGKVKPVPYYLQFDPYLQKFCHKKLYMGNRHPWQKIKAKLVKQMVNRSAEIKPEEPEMPNMQTDGKQINPDILEYIIKAGIQAPSGDNAQPWKFSYKTNTIRLYLNKDADHSFFNVNQIASIISCGAVIENMKIAATKFGLKSIITYFDDEINVAEITFSKDAMLEKDDLSEFIWKRTTNRILYEKSAVPQGLVSGLKESIKDIEGTNVYFITDRDKLEQLADLVSLADRIRTERRDLHEHLVSMIRFSMDEALEKRDGFYIKNLEAGFDGELFLKATKSWAVMKVANTLGAGKIVAQAAYKGLINSSGAGLIITSGTKHGHFLNGGQALQRIWLTLTESGYHFQPMTAITLFFLRKQIEGVKKFSKEHAMLLDDIWQRYNTLFPILNHDNNAQVMLFRFGKVSNEQKFGTLRKPLSTLKL